MLRNKSIRRLMRFIENTGATVLLAAILLCAAIPGDLPAQEPVSPLWERESSAAAGSFTRYLDSLTGVYQQAWNGSFETRLAEGTMKAHLDSLRKVFLGRILMSSFMK